MTFTEISTNSVQSRAYLPELSDISNLLALKLRKSVVIPLSFKYATPVKGSSRRDPTDVMGNRRALAARVWIMALKPMSTLPDPMISVTPIILSRSFNDTGRIWRRTGGIIRLKKSDSDAFIIENAPIFGQGRQGVIGPSGPIPSRQFRFITSHSPFHHLSFPTNRA